jgi:hypothetical protein
MAKVIAARLLESHDLHGNARRVRDFDEDDDERILDEAESDAELRRDAAGSGASSTAFKSREELVKAIGDALTYGDHGEARRLHQQLQDLDDQGDVDEEPEGKEGKHERDIGFRSGAGGAGGETRPRSTGARESRSPWVRRLFGQRSLREEREAQRRVDYWMRRLRGA